MLPAAILMLAGAQAIAPGKWSVMSTVVELSVPGVPGSLQRMARGRSKAERKRVAAGEGVDALPAPDPKANCLVEGQRVENGRYSQTLLCPQKRGEPMRVGHAGAYDGSGFSGRATVSGRTSKGPVDIVLNQRAARIGG